MAETGDLGNLNTNEWERLQNLASRFEADWNKEESVEIAAYLPSQEAPWRRVTLIELVKTELEVRWRKGKIIGLEYYAEKFPELGGMSGLPTELIYEEYRVRQVYGDKPALATFQARFPSQYPELERLVKSQPVQTLASLQQQLTPAPGPYSSNGMGSQAPQLLGDRHQLHLGGGFNLIKRLGTGGFGEVWRAEAPGGVEVAVKIVFRPLDHAEAKRELQSLELIKKLRHPFLLQTQSFHQVQDKLYIVMELADGSLRDRLKECHKANLKGIPPKELVQYFLESGEALDYLHENKVQHRDIKPENILLSGRHSKVADFGLARFQEGSRMNTATGSGTPLYMAPEIWRGKVSQHSDQYSLALTYAELRMARRVFGSTDMMQVMVDHLEKTPEFPELPEAEAGVLLKALAKDPEQRFPSCLAFAQALQDAVGGAGRRSGTDTPALPASGTSQTGTAIMGAKTMLPPTKLGDGPSTQATPAGLAAMVTQTADVPIVPAWQQKAAPPGPPRRGLFLALGALAIVAGVVGAFIIRAARNSDGTETTGSSTTNRVPEDVSVPTGFVKDENAKVVIDEKNQRKYYDQIYKMFGKEKVTFRLIRQTQTSGEPTFYIMTNKVWRSLFNLAVQDPDFDKLLKPYESGEVKWQVQRSWNLKGDGRLPIVNVTVTEAHCFAQWMKGSLPSAQQWDRASGRFEERDRRGEGPFQGFWVPGEKGIAVGFSPNSDPAPVGTSERDVSLFGVHDMAGNGLEWTQTTTRPGENVPLSKPDPLDHVLLRGRDWKVPTPFVFNEVEGAKPFDEGVYGECGPDISFRVVILP